MIEKVALVTGGSKGLGKAIVERLIKEGYNVAFTYLKSEMEAQALCESYGDRVHRIKADASDFTSALMAVEETIKKFGTLDILVNNVGLAKDRPVWELDETSWNFTISNTLNPVFYHTRAVAPIFMKKRYGKIINIGSINGLRGRQGSVGYCSAKAGIVGFSKTVAKELGEFNVCVNVVAPGFIDTDGQQNTSQLIRKMVLDECVIRKLTKPEEVAELVAFLASEKSDNITGEVIKIDCGQYI